MKKFSKKRAAIFSFDGIKNLFRNIGFTAVDNALILVGKIIIYNLNIVLI